MAFLKCWIFCLHLNMNFLSSFLVKSLVVCCQSLGIQLNCLFVLPFRFTE